MFSLLNSFRICSIKFFRFELYWRDCSIPAISRASASPCCQTIALIIGRYPCCFKLMIASFTVFIKFIYSSPRIFFWRFPGFHCWYRLEPDKACFINAIWGLGYKDCNFVPKLNSIPNLFFVSEAWHKGFHCSLPSPLLRKRE